MLIIKFSNPYLSVLKITINNFTLIGNLEYVFDIPKFLRYLIGFFPRKAFPSSAPYLNSVTRPKSVYSDDLIASPPEKQRVCFKTNFL